VGVAQSATAIATAVTALGVFILIPRNVNDALLVVTPIAATLTAAVLGLYPSSGRFVLFLVPFVLLLLGAGLWGLVGLSWAKTRIRGRHDALALGYPAVTAARNLMSPPGHEEVRTVLRHVDSKWQPGGALYVWFQSQYPFRFYAQCRDCNVLGPNSPASTIWPPDPGQPQGYYALETHAPRLYVSGRPQTLDEYIREFNPLRGKPVRFALDCLGDRLDEVRAERAVAYLYDLSKSAGLAPGTCA
jgi:hypothetical protein